MCILSFSQGHSDSCECDKCTPEELLDLPDLLEEVQEQTDQLQRCLDGLKSTEELLWSVSTDLQSLKMTSTVTSADNSKRGMYQILTPEVLVAAFAGPTINFAYSLEPLSQFPGRIWKNSRFQIELLVKCSEGKQRMDQMKFELGVYKCVLPIEEVTKGVHSKVLLRGKMVQSSVENKVIFGKLSFAEVTSNYPEKSVRLVVTSRCPGLVQPFISPPIKVISRF